MFDFGFEEVAVVGYATDAPIDVWDVQTGATIGSLKGNNCGPGCLAIGRSCFQSAASLQKHMIYSAQNGKPLVHDQAISKFVLPEKLGSMTLSNNGRYVVGAGISGRFYIWEVISGRLIGMSDSHFKPVRVVRFSKDDKGFITGGDDATVRVWKLSSFLETQQNPEPYCIFSGHTLPVTDASFEIQTFFNSKLFSVSLDKSLKIWDIASRSLLVTVLFPHPITSLALDPNLSHALAGCDNGSIHLANLYKTGEVPRPFLEGEMLPIDDDPQMVFKGHKGSITSLALSFDAKMLVSGSEDGSSCTWDIQSRQLLKKFVSKHGGPVTNVDIIFKPQPFMDATAKPLFQKTPTWQRFLTDEMPTEVPKYAPQFDEDDFLRKDFVKQTPAQKALDEIRKIAENGFELHDEAFTSLMGLEERLSQIQKMFGSQGDDESRVASLEAEVERLKQHNLALRMANDELYNACMKNNK
ncbi:WD repeat-containing protein 18 [Phlyctochytrium planicorne]|nr:WD repeat-containing protein 18 [Phlyctochytrium planicorne]